MRAIDGSAAAIRRMKPFASATFGLMQRGSRPPGKTPGGSHSESEGAAMENSTAVSVGGPTVSRELRWLCRLHAVREDVPGSFELPGGGSGGSRRSPGGFGALGSKPNVLGSLAVGFRPGACVSSLCGVLVLWFLLLWFRRRSDGLLVASVARLDRSQRS